ncbi:hypothetical protein C8R41DRAFT_536188 [Lentinula lateritia]|uniref:Uncharacterized protein n=1 Tax=Lentinula lateritia TaxID=40482 RepID=A0ABQ8V9K7_9AGAR|nr:hypothetical protein C8R41DRAFT_536188 [Lentinula lateritia]
MSRRICRQRQAFLCAEFFNFVRTTRLWHIQADIFPSRVVPWLYCMLNWISAVTVKAHINAQTSGQTFFLFQCSKAFQARFNPRIQSYTKSAIFGTDMAQGWLMILPVLLARTEPIPNDSRLGGKWKYAQRIAAASPECNP